MKKNTLLILCALAVSVTGIATAKSYSFTLTAPTKAGTTTLKPGDYQVELKGTDAVFTNPDGKTIKVPVKVGQGDKKFGTTLVDTGSKDGATVIREIDLAGSTTKLQFGE